MKEDTIIKICFISLISLLNFPPDENVVIFKTVKKNHGNTQILAAAL